MPPLMLGDVAAYGPTDGGVLLLGQAPNKWMHDHNRPDHALWRRDLAELARLTMPEYYRLFTRANLLQEYPGKAGKGDAFPMRLARPAAKALRPHLSAFKEVVFLGKMVAEAFSHWGDWFEWRGDAPRLAMSPHPSRISTWWNIPGHGKRAGQFWLDLAAVARGRVGG